MSVKFADDGLNDRGPRGDMTSANRHPATSIWTSARSQTHEHERKTRTCHSHNLQGKTTKTQLTTRKDEKVYFTRGDTNIKSFIN